MSSDRLIPPILGATRAPGKGVGLLAALLLVGCGDPGETDPGLATPVLCDRQTDAIYDQASASSGAPLWWAPEDVASCVGIALDPAGSPDLSQDLIKAALQGAINTWNAAADQCGVPVCLRYAGERPRAAAFGNQGSTGDEHIVTFLGDDWRETHGPHLTDQQITDLASRFQGSSLAFGVALSAFFADNGQLFDVDIALNDARFRFCAGPTIGPDCADLESVLLHELGHALAFADLPDQPNAVMGDALAVGVTRRTLAAGDEAGVCEIYACY